nr:hypothetical protein [Tanacetum cinerariifolium]
MLDRVDFASWQQSIWLYYRGKENWVNIHMSIDEGPFQIGTIRETLAKCEEGALYLGPEQDRVVTDLSPQEKDRYNAGIHAINILHQGLPKEIYTLINHYTNAKYIWDNVKMLLEGAQVQLVMEEVRTELGMQILVKQDRTMFMTNMSSADSVYDEAGPSYDLDILSEVHEYDNYQDAICEHHEAIEMHHDIQPNYVVDSNANYMSDSNMIPYD